MNDNDKTKEQLLAEVVELRRRIIPLEARETEHERAKEELRQLKEFSESIIQNMAEGIIVEDEKGYLTFVNPATATLLGYSPQELVGQHWTAMIPPDQHAIVQAADERRVRGEADHYELKLRHRDGTPLRVLVRGQPRFDATGCFLGTLAVFIDISEFKRAEEALQTSLEEMDMAYAQALLYAHDLQTEVAKSKREGEIRAELEHQLRQSQKMEAIGRLAGGIAHDFNNLLTAIMGYSGMALEALPSNHPVRSDIEGIQRTAQRAAGLTRQLLAFARQQVIEPKVLNLNDLILDVENLLRRLIGEDIELLPWLASDLGLVRVDPNQLEQVLVNLAVNARDAMPNGGKLIIETTNMTLDPYYARRQVEVTPGEYVLLVVSDTGTGMTEEVKARPFEPFFTTKGIGKGTGLGLATCFGIVKQNGGHIRVYSEPGQGTTFKIYLPRVGEGANLSAPHDLFADLVRGTETILLTEDDTVVRDQTARVLRDHGYTVLEAANGNEALQTIQDQVEKEIQLLVTDVVMPRMGGIELAERLKESYPTIKVLFVSGYTNTTIIHHSLSKPGSAFLPKPFSPQVLIHKVREVLDMNVEWSGDKKEGLPTLVGQSLRVTIG